MPRKRDGDAISGWICLDKPHGAGSTQAVTRVRRAFNARKAGHAGTLDPLATGVLPIALGEATKTVSFLLHAEKAYRFTIAWGASTAGLDSEGPVTATSPIRPANADIEHALASFVGDIEQTPPDFSAVKIGGERAYRLARAGSLTKLEPRRVVLHQARLLGQRDRDHSEFEITCGKGFYVRALARDLAVALGACGHVSSLRRTRVGPFGEAAAVGLEFIEQLCDRAAALEALLPVETPLDDIPALAVTPEDASRLVQGRSIVLIPRQAETLKLALGASPMVVARENGRLVALCEMRAGRLSPTRVFHLA